MRKIINLILILFSISNIGFAQNNKLSLETCRKMAIENNRKIKIDQEHENALSSLQKAAKTQFFPNFSFNGGYLHTNKDFNMLENDLFLPIVPQEAIVDGNLDPSVLSGNPELMAETFVLTDVMGHQVPASDADGNPLFQNYAYVPKDAASFGLKNMFLLNVGMTQPIYMGGKIRELNKLAKYTKEISGEKVNLTISEIIINTDKYYWKIISLKEKVELTNRYKKLITNLIKDLNNLYEEGIITRNSILKAKVKYNQIALKLLKAENGLALSRMALNQSIGMPLDTIIQLSDSIVVEPKLIADDDLQNRALEQRPEISMINKSVKIAESTEKIARSRYLPNIGLTANYMMSNPNPYKGFAQEFGGDWNVGILINIPLYHWGDKRHTLNATKHEKKAVHQKLEEAKELITLEVNQSLYKYEEAIKKVELTKSSLKQAEENLKITNDNFTEGLIKTTEVLDAQTMWQESYADFIEAKTEFKISESNLLKVSGELNQTIK
ncbi:MAG: TolC family protein [Bacteroidales bacterium]|jgi:outer membrane protein|nr:TolC family protein [Bacteroidales bacterium]